MRGERNESSSFGFPATSWHNLMPTDQRTKLLAMHKESTANAGMYVAVVLAVYVVLLSLLLCRYVKRRGPGDSWLSWPCQGCCSVLLAHILAILHSGRGGPPPPTSTLSSESYKDEGTELPHQLLPLQVRRQESV